MQKIKNIFLTQRFYLIVLAICVILVVGNFFAWLFVVGKLFLIVFAGLLITDFILLFNGTIVALRDVNEKFSNGDYNPVYYSVTSKYKYPITIQLSDELPFQFQERNFKITTHLAPNETFKHKLKLRPVQRGIYSFGRIRVFTLTPICFIKYRFTQGIETNVSVYPSFIKLKEMATLALSPTPSQNKSFKLQRPGNSKEFEQIKEYVNGDDYKKLNWKATARFNKLMVNEYQEERSLHIYQLIDMGRTMKMPFKEMTLLDYAINASLAVANIILKKNDKTGLITYSSKVHSIVKSNRRKSQITHLFETLYAQKTNFSESNLEQVYYAIKRNTFGRSLLIFYTNFESNTSFERQLPLLRQLAKQHLVLLVTFINTEMEQLVKSTANSYEDVYRKALAGNHMLENDLLMDQLNKHGIMHMKVRPNELSLSVINKYLEIKERGLL